MTHRFKRRAHREAWDYGLPDAYDKSWLTDVTVAERRVRGADDLPPLMGHCYQVKGSRGQTEWRCQKCGVLWETNRADPRRYKG